MKTSWTSFISSSLDWSYLYGWWATGGWRHTLDILLKLRKREVWTVSSEFLKYCILWESRVASIPVTFCPFIAMLFYHLSDLLTSACWTERRCFLSLFLPTKYLVLVVLCNYNAILCIIYQCQSQGLVRKCICISGKGTFRKTI